MLSSQDVISQYSSVPESIPKPNTDLKEAVIFTLFDREYHIYGEKIITDVEASPIYEKLLLETKSVPD
jgi:hypothetical protein